MLRFQFSTRLTAKHKNFVFRKTQKIPTILKFPSHHICHPKKDICVAIHAFYSE